MGLLSKAFKNVIKDVSKTTDKLPIKDVQPTKTRSAYRIATQAEDGKLYPLFVNASDEIPVGEWVSATVPPVTFKGINGHMYVPSKGAARSKGEISKATGDLQVLPDQETMDQLRKEGFSIEKPSKSAPFGKVRAVASRPGFHATTKPVAHHLGPEDLIISSAERDKLLKAGVTPKAFKEKTFYYLDDKLIGKAKIKNLSDADKKKVTSKKKYYVKRRAEDQVFVEVDMADDTSEDLLRYMQDRGRTDINDKLPSGGSYTYQDGQADAETWVVGGDMRVNRVLSREEAKAAQEAAGVKDLPYRDEIEKILGRKFAKGGLAGEVGMYTGQEDSILAASYAEGGLTIEQEMSQFNEGGLSQEGGMIDEESGNEVPIGSTRKEVRDDIPAQVSEGEFVFPADVVRFLGLEKLMEMRQGAKMGLKQMEAMGQMGNSDEATVPDDMPFGMADLVVIGGSDEKPQEKAYGGMAKKGVPSGMHRMPDGSLMKDSDMPQKKADGGLFLQSGGSIRMPDFDFSNQDVRIYVKEGSPDRRIPFFDGEPVIPIPAGYTLKGSAPVEEETETEKAIPTGSDRDPTSPFPNKTPFQEAGGWNMEFGDPPDAAKVDLWIKEAEKTTGNAPMIMTGVGALFGGLPAAFIHGANKWNASSRDANLERVLKAAGQTTTKGQVDALNKIKTDAAKGADKSLLSKAIEGVKNLLGISEEETKTITKTTIDAGNSTPKPETPEEAARKETESETSVPVQIKERVSGRESEIPSVPTRTSVETQTDAALVSGRESKIPSVPTSTIQENLNELQFLNVDVNSIMNKQYDDMLKEVYSGVVPVVDALDKVNPKASETIRKATTSASDITSLNPNVQAQIKDSLPAAEAARNPDGTTNISDIVAGSGVDLTKKDKDPIQPVTPSSRRDRDPSTSVAEQMQQNRAFNKQQTKGSGNRDIVFKRAVKQQIDAGNTSIEDMQEKAKQTIKGQEKGKGYVGGSGFKKGGLASRRK